MKKFRIQVLGTMKKLQNYVYLICTSIQWMPYNFYSSWSSFLSDISPGKSFCKDDRNTKRVPQNQNQSCYKFRAKDKITSQPQSCFLTIIGFLSILYYTRPFLRSEIAIMIFFNCWVMIFVALSFSHFEIHPLILNCIPNILKHIIF